MFDEYASWIVKGLQHILKGLYQVRESDIFGPKSELLWRIKSQNAAEAEINHKAASHIKQRMSLRSPFEPLMGEVGRSSKQRTDVEESSYSDFGNGESPNKQNLSGKDADK